MDKPTDKSTEPTLYAITEQELGALRATLRGVALPEGPRELLAAIQSTRQIPRPLVRQLRAMVADARTEDEGDGPRRAAVVIGRAKGKGKGRGRKHPAG